MSGLLRGPDPDRFRIQRNGARHYIDPLPADDRWPAWDGLVPSVTTIKKSWSKPFRKRMETGVTVSLDAYWAGEYVLDHLDVLTDADDRDAALELIATAPARSLAKAADRGTQVHLIMEQLADG